MSVLQMIILLRKVRNSYEQAFDYPAGLDYIDAQIANMESVAAVNGDMGISSISEADVLASIIHELLTRDAK